jgi:hypothetical protein
MKHLILRINVNNHQNETVATEGTLDISGQLAFFGRQTLALSRKSKRLHALILLFIHFL